MKLTYLDFERVKSRHCLNAHFSYAEQSDFEKISEYCKRFVKKFSKKPEVSELKDAPKDFIGLQYFVPKKLRMFVSQNTIGCGRFFCINYETDMNKLYELYKGIFLELEPMIDNFARELIESHIKEKLIPEDVALFVQKYLDG